MPLNVLGGGLEFDAVIRDSQFEASIRKIESQLQGLTATATKEAGAIDSLVRKTATAIAGYASFAVGTNFISDIVKVRGQMQQLEVAFSTMLGSKEKADALLKQVTEFAATTPFELTEVAGATKQLLAFGIASEDIEGTLRSLGDVSAGIGAPLGDISYLFGTIKTQGVALTQDVRQFAQRGIPVYEELAKILKVSTEQVGEFITAGKVGFPEIQQVFQNLTAEGSKFGGLMEAQSHTLTGQISNLHDAYSQMLNDLGKSGEGIFSDIISGATFAIKNFEEVLKIIKILVITYGSYRAAIIATSVAQSIATTLTKGYTVAETLRYQAMLLSERATKLLNRTMLTNPAIAIATGIGALVAALTIFTKRTSEAQRQQKALNDVQVEAKKAVLAETTALDALVKVAKDETLSKQQRETAIRRINAISPEYLGNLTLENLKTAEGKKLLDEYVKSLNKKAQAQAIDNKLTQVFEENIDFEAKIEKTKGRGKGGALSSIVNSDFIQNTVAKAGLEENQKLIEKLQDKQKKLIEENIKGEGDTQTAKARTISVIDEEIKANQDLQKAGSASAAQYDTFQKKINALEAEKKRITGSSKSEASAATTQENKSLAMLQKRNDLLEKIQGMIRDGEQSGYAKQIKEQDKINERYDQMIQNISEYNSKVDAFNKKNKTNVSKIGLSDIYDLNDSRNRELANSNMKEQAELFVKSLDEQLALYEKYEEAKKEVGLKKATELFGEQSAKLESTLNDLKALQAGLSIKFSLGIQSEADEIRFTAVNKALADIAARRQQKELDDEKQKYVALLEAAATYNDQKAAINKKYDELEATLRKKGTDSETAERKQILVKGRQDEIDSLNDEVDGKMQVFKDLFDGVEKLSDKAAKKVIADAKAMLAKLVAEGKISAEFAKLVADTLTQATQALGDRLPERLQRLSSAFSSMASAASGFSQELSNVLSTASSIIGAVGDIKQGFADFKAAKENGDAFGQATAGIGIAGAAISAASSIIKGFQEAKASRVKSQQEIKDFQASLLAGEVQYNELVRQRHREEVKAGKLRLQALQDEKKLLLEQKQAAASTYSDVLKKLQSESFISGKGSKTKTGILGALTGGLLGYLSGQRTEAVNQLQSLAGKSFDEIEKLFLSGQLTDGAKKLFEQLQRVKEEGVDIDALLAENAENARQIFTGTTSDSIVDSIADGFKNGLKTASDFASTFEDLMRNALIQSLKFKYLEGPLKAFFQDFADASESGGQLDSSEVTRLRDQFNGMITNFNQQFQQIQQVAGIGFAGTGSSTNSLSGAIKGMTEQQAELLAGQFGGLRLTAIEILVVSRNQLSTLNNIQTNTAAGVARMIDLLTKYDNYETGAKLVHVKVH